MRSQSGEIEPQTLKFLLIGSLFCAETWTAVVLPGSPYVYNIVVMGIHVQSMSLASCAVLCWKDKTEFIVQQSTEPRQSSSKIYRSMSHARCKNACFVRAMLCDPATLSAKKRRPGTGHTAPREAGEHCSHFTACSPDPRGSTRGSEQFAEGCPSSQRQDLKFCETSSSETVPSPTGQAKDKAGTTVTPIPPYTSLHHRAKAFVLPRVPKRRLGQWACFQDTEIMRVVTCARLSPKIPCPRCLHPRVPGRERL